MTITLATSVRNAVVDALVALIDADAGAGTLKIYDGTKPAGPNTAITTQVLLATFNLGVTSYGAASAGVATLQGTPLSATGVAASTATWFRVADNTGDPCMDGTCGTDLTMNTYVVSIGVNLQITSGTITAP